MMERILSECRVRGFTTVVDLEPVVITQGGEPEPLSFTMRGASSTFRLEMQAEIERGLEVYPVHLPPAPFFFKNAVHMTAVLDHAPSGGSPSFTVRLDTIEARAERGYERYVADCGGKSVHGEPLPPWDLTKPEIRKHWVAAFTE